MNKTSFTLLFPKPKWCRIKSTYHFGCMDNFGYLAEVDFLALTHFINGNGEMSI